MATTLRSSCPVGLPKSLGFQLPAAWGSCDFPVEGRARDFLLLTDPCESLSRLSWRGRDGTDKGEQKVTPSTEAEPQQGTEAGCCQNVGRPLQRKVTFIFLRKTSLDDPNSRYGISFQGHDSSLKSS